MFACLIVCLFVVVIVDVDVVVVVVFVQGMLWATFV